jgi:RNA polymerase sigma factor (sigma-70 family)
MKHHVEFKGFGPSDSSEPKGGVRELIERLLARLEKRAKSFSPDVLFARVMVEQKPAHKLYHVSITFEMPEKTLAAKKETYDLEAGIREAFNEIQRQLEDHKATLRGEPHWKQLERRGQIHHMRSHTPVSEVSEAFFAVVNPYVSRLKEFVSHVIGFAEARGDLARGQLTVDDVVDETLLEAYGEFLRNPTPGNIQAWLIRLATKQVAAEIKRTKFDRDRTVHIEKKLPETPPREEVSTLGDEILDFYQPDEDLKMEDIVPDLEVPTPEQELEREELRQCVRTAFNTMPAESRRVLLLHYIQGLSEAKLAKTVGKGEPEIKRILDSGREYLRRRLIESGCTLRAVDSEASLRTEVEATSKKLVG